MIVVFTDILPNLSLSSWSVIYLVRSTSQYWISEKTLNRFKRYIFVDSCKTFHITNVTTLDAAKSSHQTIFSYAVHSGVSSCVWMGNSSKSKFLHQRDLELWDSRCLLIFPPLYPKNCQESCIFLLLLQIIHSFQLQEECLKAHCNPNVLCSTQFCAIFLCTKTLFCGFVLLWRTKWVFLNFVVNKNSQFLKNVFYLPGQYLVQCKTYYFKCLQNWNWRAEIVLREDKRIVQSRDRANMNLVLAQSCNSNLDHVPSLRQHHHVVLCAYSVNTLKWGFKTPGTSPQSQWFHQT